MEDLEAQLEIVIKKHATYRAIEKSIVLFIKYIETEMDNINNINTVELLRFATENNIIDIAYVQEQIEMKRKEEYLSKHPYKVWEGNDGYWRTYIPGNNGKRKLVKKKDRQSIDNVIVEYLDKQGCDTFKERYFIWVERQKAIGRSDNTISKYESDYKRFFENDEFENMDIASITEEHICQLFKRILGCKSIPYRALKSAFGYINGVFEKSIMDKKIQHNPCKYVDLPLFKQYCAQPKPKTTEQRTLSNNEKKALLSKIRNEGSMARYAVELSLYTGMRVGELSGLKWEDIDFNKETITICRSEKYNRKKKEYYISTTKNDKIRTIPMTKEMKDLLLRVKTKEIQCGYLTEFVFSNENGRIHARTISDCARNNTMTVEFTKPKSIHAIRRTLNSNLKCMGVPTPVAASILGHVERVNEENYTYDVSSIDVKRDYIEKASKIS